MVRHRGEDPSAPTEPVTSSEESADGNPDETVSDPRQSDPHPADGGGVTDDKAGEQAGMLVHTKVAYAERTTTKSSKDVRSLRRRK